MAQTAYKGIYTRKEMSDKVRISAVVQTYNAEKHLEKCLKALEPFDEILVVDMESTDATRDIAGRVGARVVAKDRKSVV